MEMAGSLSKRRFVAAARRYVPELRVEDVVPGPSGIRAQALDRDGSLVDDFRISFRGPVVALRNAPSPAATSSLAIAEHLVDAVLGRHAATGADRPVSTARWTAGSGWCSRPPSTPTGDVDTGRCAERSPWPSGSGPAAWWPSASSARRPPCRRWSRQQCWPR